MMTAVFGIIGLCFLIWLHYRAVENSALKLYYFPALCIKVIAGVGVGLVYQYYYQGGDTWNYFNAAIDFAEAGFSSQENFVDLFFLNKYELIGGFPYHYQPRAALMVKIVAVINVFTHSNYWITSIFFTFFSFVGIYKFANWVAINFNYGQVAGLFLFIWPGFVFWSSGILKETLAVGLIFFSIPTFFEWLKTKSAIKLSMVLISLYFLFLVKYYFSVVLFVTLLLYSIFILLKLDSKKRYQQFFAWLLMLVFGFLLGGFLHPNLRFENVLGIILENYNSFKAISSFESLIQFNDDYQHWMWFFVNSPKALFASLFLPLNFGNSLTFSLSAFENWLLIALLIRGLFLINLQVIKDYFLMVLASFSYVIILAIFLALSTPNLGTLSRYKVSFIPIVLVLIILANRFKYLQKKR